MINRLQAFGLVVSIDVPSAAIVEELSRRLPKFPEAPPDSAPDITYRITTSGRGLTVLRGRRTIGEAADVSSAADGLVSDLQAEFGRLAPGCAFIHAGVVVTRGHAILLPAHSSAGKTSLVTALVRAGAHYGSDEFAVVDAAGLVHPYARHLASRTGRRFVAPAELAGGATMTEPVSVGAIVFTRYRRGAVLQRRALAPGATLLQLLEHTLGARQRPGQTLRLLRAMASGAPAFDCARGEADVAARRLLTWARAGWITPAA